MKQMLLLPYSFKRIGWVLFLSSAFFWILASVFEWDINAQKFDTFAISSDGLMQDGVWFGIVETGMGITVLGSLFIIGGLLLAFSREKIEDEFITELRLASFQWAVLVHYILLLLRFFFIYGISFFTVMAYNMFTILILFNLRFYYLLHRSRKNIMNEESN